MDKYGKKWAYITQLFFPEKDTTTVKNRFYNYIKRKKIYNTLLKEGKQKNSIREELK